VHGISKQVLEEEAEEAGHAVPEVPSDAALTWLVLLQAHQACFDYACMGNTCSLARAFCRQLMSVALQDGRADQGLFPQSRPAEWHITSSKPGRKGNSGLALIWVSAAQSPATKSAGDAEVVSWPELQRRRSGKREVRCFANVSRTQRIACFECTLVAVISCDCVLHGLCNHDGILLAAG
jgi:hypothetical protein